MKEKDYDVLVSYRVYPSADNIFSLALLPLEVVIAECVFVLDTIDQRGFSRYRANTEP